MLWKALIMILFSLAFISTVQLQPPRQGRCFRPAAGCHLHSLGEKKTVVCFCCLHRCRQMTARRNPTAPVKRWLLKYDCPHPTPPPHPPSPTPAPPRHTTPQGRVGKGDDDKLFRPLSRGLQRIELGQTFLSWLRFGQDRGGAAGLKCSKRHLQVSQAHDQSIASFQLTADKWTCHR